MTDYKALKDDLDNYLQSIGVSATVELRGDACPPFCEDKGKPGIGKFPRKTHIHGRHYELALTRGDKRATVDYWNSYKDAETVAIGWNGRNYKSMAEYHRAVKEAKTVRAADVLGCCQLYDCGTFEDFCSEFGYDSDSRKAEQTYNAVRQQLEDFKRLFTAEELQTIAEKVAEL